MNTSIMVGAMLMACFIVSILGAGETIVTSPRLSVLCSVSAFLSACALAAFSFPLITGWYL